MLTKLSPKTRLAAELALAAAAMGAGDALLTALTGGVQEPAHIAKAMLVGAVAAVLNLYRHKPGMEPPPAADPPKS